ncbi:hypothetical protein CK216_24725 [Mesorhizobium sp. WSM3876]|nr:hypothetical protein CK216_24725 [Mesorhizobium sp. WSM3876]
MALHGAPLCPAGHLPHEGPTRGKIDVAPAFANHQVRRRAPSAELPISPQVGEMPGRAEGGAVPPAYRLLPN